ncbi:MAG: GmrSD restriction endonuclease domain-containing protein [Candidatus Heimdallarchaeaceae archaeon]
MNDIDADDQTIRQVLDNKKYIVDFFQREYQWQSEHVLQLLDDLITKFLANYKKSHSIQDVKKYEKYYLGPVVMSEKDGAKSIIDGQQRLTTVTLLLIYLNNLQKNRNEKVSIDSLIFSDDYAIKSFNIYVEERKECIEALYNGQEYNPEGKGESVLNIVERYKDIEENFPDEIKDEALPYFIYWLRDNVIFVEIFTESDEDAYSIFETMNDRGLNLTATEMLKGYILSNVGDDNNKRKLNQIWKNEISEINKIDKEEDLEFFKAWLRAKYADTIRLGRKGAANEDFEKIGTRFHSWVRDNKERLSLNSNSDFYDFVDKTLRFYAKIYKMIDGACVQWNEELESIYYIDERRLAASLSFPLLMAPITMNDDMKTIKNKMALVATYLEIFVVLRSLNYRNYAHSSIRYTMYTLVKEIRDKSVDELATILRKKAESINENLDGVLDFGMHGQNKRFIKFILARITYFIEKKSNVPSSFVTYMSRNIAKPFQVEHIWSDDWDQHKDEFDQRDEFEDYRNKFGALILLPEGFNQSYGALPYEEKLPHYFGQNLLAKSLNPKCYERNPSFLNFKAQSNLPFKPHEIFKKKDIEERQKLYKKILEQIYDFNKFDEIKNR